MTAAVIPFAFEDQLVRVVKPNGEPWFVGRDVCRVLEIKNESQALDRLDADERQNGVCIIDPMGREQTVIVVSEPGVFRLIFTSRKPEAERFKRWLAHEVLPQLRKTGQYAIGGKPKVEPYDIPTDAEPLQAYGLKLDTVRLAARVHGLDAARAMWNSLGLPAVPGFEPAREDDARRCLACLLDRNISYTGSAADTPIGWLIETALEDGDLARMALKNTGIHVSDGADEGIVVANRCPPLEKVFEATPWSNGRWRGALVKLPGAKPHHQRLRFGFDNKQSRGTFVPLALLELPPAPRPNGGNIVPLNPNG